VTVTSATAVLEIEVPTAIPDPDPLMEALDGAIPTGVSVVIDAGVGQRVDAGTVGVR